MNTAQCIAALNKTNIVSRFFGPITVPANGWKRVRKCKAKSRGLVLRDFVNGDVEMTVVTDATDTNIVEIIEAYEFYTTGTMNGSDYYFQLLMPGEPLTTEQEECGIEIDVPVFWITNALYYDKYGGTFDSQGYHNTPLPSDFGAERNEGEWDYDGDPQVGRQSLLNAGFVEKRLV